MPDFFQTCFPFKLLFFNKLHHSLSLTAYGASNGLVFVDLKRCWLYRGCKHAPTISDGRQPREADKPLMPAGYAENEPTSPYSIAVRNTFIDTWACFGERRATRLFLGGCWEKWRWNKDKHDFFGENSPNNRATSRDEFECSFCSHLFKKKHHLLAILWCLFIIYSSSTFIMWCFEKQHISKSDISAI